ncbi:MAG: hypothetical protein JSV65_03175 [Armatimonadota bacterium]|nr:MAG: hypothetical protein JSV65_03175 [Armatimonadota bacterium]
MRTDLAKRDELSPCLRLAIPGVAMWLGWGIRGQIGHERGAMIPGSLAGLSLAFTSADPEVHRRTGLLGAAGAMGTSFGGTETYGQTLGLSHGPTRAETYWWGLLGCAVKGGAWIGLSGTYLGMAASDRDYGPLEMMWLTAQSTALWHLGVEMVNRPHEPPDNLPRIYFSGRAADKPRPEVWAGQWFALLGLLGYALVKRDTRTLIMGAYGILGGAAGFAGGQAVQAWGTGKQLREGVFKYVGWWKVMETTFGLIAGTYLGAGMMIAESASGALPPRRRYPFAEKAIARAAGHYVLYDHLRERPWTGHGMDSMVVGGLALADAFACDLAAWLETLPLVHGYTAKDTVEHWRTIEMNDVIPDYTRGVLKGIGAMAALAAMLALLQRDGTRRASAIGLLADAWGQTIMSHVKMLLTHDVLGLDEPRQPALPAGERAKDLVARMATRQTGQFVVEAAFTVAAVVLTGLVAWALSKRGD